MRTGRFLCEACFRVDWKFWPGCAPLVDPGIGDGQGSGKWLDESFFDPKMEETKWNKGNSGEIWRFGDSIGRLGEAGVVLRLMEMIC